MDSIERANGMGDHIRKLLRERLLRSQAVHFRNLIQFTGMDEDLVREEVDRMVEAGEVEVLRPMSEGEETLGVGTPRRHWWYRLIRPTDNDYLWQQDGFHGFTTNRPQTKGIGQMQRFAEAVAGGVLALGLATAAVAADSNKIVVDGSTTVGPIAKAWAEYYMNKNPGVNITVSESGSGNGAKSLLNAACDVATMSRPMKSSELKSAQEAGVMVIEHKAAMDGIAVIVHPSNPVKALTIAQIRDIYLGRIVNWKDLGGPDRPIVVISRDTNSGTYEAFETLVLNKEKIAANAEYVGSNGAIRQRVLTTENAIGYVGLAFLEGVKALEVNGIAPTHETVLDKTYPVSRPLYMYTNGRPKAGSHLDNYIKLAGTPEGRKLVEDAGFVAMP